MELKEFTATMLRLSKAIPRFAPDFTDKETLLIWHTSLMDIPDESLRDALGKLVSKCNEFPSIATIRSECLGRKASPKLAGKEVAEAIWDAMTKCGPKNSPLAYVGEVGMQVIDRCGGWERLHENTLVDEKRFVTSQWAALAQAIFERDSDARSPFDALPPADEFKALTPAQQEQKAEVNRIMKQLSDHITVKGNKK